MVVNISYRAGCASSAVSTDSAIFALPAQFRNIGQQRSDAEGVVALVARVTDEHLGPIESKL